MRINPLHESTCHNRIGMYRGEQCIAGPHPCTFLGECDQHYDPETGDWDYPDPLAPYVSPAKPKFDPEKELTSHERSALTAARNGNREAVRGKTRLILDRDEIIRKAVMQHTDKCGAVYTDDLIKATGLDKRVITDYLKRTGFEKRAGSTSRRWVKDWAPNPLDHFVTPEDPPADPDEEQERDPPLDEDKE
jgi:hypothetical protein